MAREPIHPGEFLIDELEEIEITATELGSKILKIHRWQPEAHPVWWSNKTGR
ncbi:MAG: hypothetical protein V7711_17410 [Pseudomonadales bacterium]